MCLFCCAGCPSGTCEAEGGSGLETCSGALEAPSLHYCSDSCLCVCVGVCECDSLEGVALSPH